MGKLEKKQNPKSGNGKKRNQAGLRRVTRGREREIYPLSSMKTNQVVRNYYVLPCCLLLLNLCTELVGYKARMIDHVLLRTAAIMGLVLFGASLVSFVVA